MPIIRYRKRWLIECPLSVKAQFAIPDSCYETIGGVGYLVTFATGTPKNQYAGQAPEMRFLGANPTYTPSSVRREFNLDVSDGRACFYFAVKEIARIAVTSLWTSTPKAVRVLDYLFPENEDYAIAVASGMEAFTLRLGIIDVASVVPNSPMVGLPEFVASDLHAGQYIKDGFKFEFSEAKLRDV